MASSISDRISNLPDEVIWHILDFLPTNTAVSTSVLSKRWEFLWKYIFDLHFDDELINNDYKGDKINMCISNVLKQLKVKRIRSLSLNCNDESLHGYNDSKVREWFLDMIQLKVQHLELCSSSRNSITLPRVLFNNVASLVELKLSGNIGLRNLPEDVCFPNLKTLDLVSLDSFDIVPIRKLISGCLALEKLYIELSSRLSRWAVCNISSSSLTHLTIIINEYEQIRLNPYYEPVGIEGTQVKLDVPNLRYIRVRDDDGQLTEFSVVGRLSSLIEVNINLCCNCDYDVKLIRGFVKQINDVKMVTIPISTIQALSLGQKDIFAIFQNVTHLKIKPDIRKWHLISHILERSTNLQVLTVLKGRDSLRRTEERRYESRHVPKCLTSSLEQITIYGYEGRNDEFQMVKYLLENGLVLERMEIHVALEAWSRLSRPKMQMLYRAAMRRDIVHFF